MLEIKILQSSMHVITDGAPTWYEIYAVNRWYTLKSRYENSLFSCYNLIAIGPFDEIKFKL